MFSNVQVASALNFLHNDASIIHCNISPDSIVLTTEGSWKLAGLGFTTPTGFGTQQGSDSVFDFSHEPRSAVARATKASTEYT